MGFSIRVLIIIAPLLLGQILFAQKKADKIDSVCTSLFNKGEFNGNILVAEKGEPIYQKSFGIANESTGEKLNSNSVFELASVSKQFTAMAIVILKETGKLAYDDKMSKYLPELNFYENVTVRNLLNHTGGLPDYMLLMDSLYDKKKIATNKDIIELFAKHKPKSIADPGTKFLYSNTGYALLASIIERVSGKTYADFLNESIFVPLKMNNTLVYTRRYAPKKVDNYAYGYIYNDSLKKNFLPDSVEETKMVIWMDGIVGDGTVNSTTTDLLKWDRSLYTESLVSKSSLKEIFTPPVLKKGMKSNYGFGWSVEKNKYFGKITSHGGGWPGYLTYIERHTDHDKTIIILQNTDRAYIPIKEIRSILYNRIEKASATRKEIQLPKETLVRYIGSYEIEKGFVIKIFMEGNELKAQATGQDPTTIFAEAENKFFYKEVEAQIEFIPDKEKKISKLILHQGGNNIEGLKIN